MRALNDQTATEMFTLLVGILFLLIDRLNIYYQQRNPHGVFHHTAHWFHPNIQD